MTTYGETQDGKRVLIDTDKAILRVSVYGILSWGKKLLVTKTYLPLWEFPGGAVEKGETLFLALQREFKEETGIEIDVKEFIVQRECFYLSPIGKIFHSFQNFFVVKNKKIKNSVRGFTKQPQVRWINKKNLSVKNMKLSAYDAFLLFMKKNKFSGCNFITTVNQG